MKNFSIFKVLNTFFRLFIIFLIVFVWIKYSIENFWLSLLFSIILLVVIETLYQVFTNKKQAKSNIKKEEQEKINQYTNTFIYCDKKYTTDFFYNLCKKNYECTKKSKYILISHPTTNIALYPLFLYRELSIDDVIDCYNQTKHEKIKRLVICTNKYANDIQKFIETLNIEVLILDKQQTYLLLLKKYEIYPKITKICDKQKMTFRQFLNIALDKKRAKSYFLSAIFLLFASMFVFYKIYYLIFATILLVMCFLCLFRKRTIKPTQKQILDI